MPPSEAKRSEEKEVREQQPRRQRVSLRLFGEEGDYQ